MESKTRKLQSLRRKQDFERLKAHGFRSRPKSWLVLNALPNENLGMRCGWTIQKRVGSAVIRNRLKRWCRVFFRKYASELDLHLDINVVFLTHKGKVSQMSALTHEELDLALQKAWEQIYHWYKDAHSMGARIL